MHVSDPPTSRFCHASSRKSASRPGLHCWCGGGAGGVTLGFGGCCGWGLGGGGGGGGGRSGAVVLCALSCVRAAGAVAPRGGGASVAWPSGPAPPHYNHKIMTTLFTC